MRKKLSRLVICFVLAFTLCFGATGCGGGQANGMVIGTTEFVDTLNPLTAWSNISIEAFTLIYDPLVRYDENLESTPCLAEDWDVSKDNLTWTFKLAEATWHDGEAFTSEDVKFTYELLLGELGSASYYGSYVTGIEEITCPDDRTVVIKCSEPKANMLQSTAPILPEHIWSEVAEADLETYENENPIGTGPYMLSAMDETTLSLTLNESYFGTPGKVPAYTFVEYDSADSAAQALKTGEITGATSLSATQLEELKGEEGIDVISGTYPGFTQLAFNMSDDSTGNPLMKDKTIRHAIEYCTDKKQVVDMAYGGAGKVGTTMIHDGDKYHWEPTEDVLRDYDVDKANEILDAAGYTDTNGDGIREANGEPLKFELISISDNTEEVKIGQIIKSGCQKAGIEIECVTMDSGALSDKIYEYSYDMFIWGWGADVDPGAIMTILTEGYGYNEPGWYNDEYEALYAAQATEMDDAKRMEIIHDMQKLVYEEAPYAIIVYDNFIQAVRSDTIEGFKQIPNGGCYFLNMSIVNYINASMVTE